VPYGPHLEPGSEASKEATKKRRNDASAGSVGKHVKVSSQKTTALKSLAAPKCTIVASSKAASSHARSAPKAGTPLKTGAPPKVVVPNNTATQAVPKAEVLRISTRVKRSASTEPSSTPKGKQVKVNVASSPASAPIHRAIVRPQPPTESDDGRVAA
jgi:hypothetical protein